jgi:hypothetical protein
MHPPVHYEELASKAMAEGRWLEAAEHWQNAVWASMGRGRRERYRMSVRYCQLRAEGKNEEEANQLASQ